MMITVNILGNYPINKWNMEKEFSILLIVMFIWDVGKKINSMGMECMYIRMGKNIVGSLLMGRSVEEEHIIIKVGPNIKDNGKKIKKMDLEYSFIQIIKSMKEIGWMVKKVVKELTTMLQEISILGNG